VPLTLSVNTVRGMEIISGASRLQVNFSRLVGIFSLFGAALFGQAYPS